MAINKSAKPAKGRLSHPLSGADIGTLLTVMARFGPPSPANLPKAVLTLLAAIGRLPFSAIDALTTGLKRKRFEPIEPPIFILGHWRSGTTHLYNIMTRSPGFQFVSPFATALPWDFLSLTRLLGPLLERALPKHRYIDNIPVMKDSPQEDEIGLANMTPNSFYHALYFPKRFETIFDRGIFFDGMSEREKDVWARKLRYFYLKLQIERPGARLLIKNPVYTARPALLAKIWPGAKFIHIHRSPYKVFFSMRNFYAKLFAEFALQPFDHIDVDAHIFRTYSRMMAGLERDRAEIPEEDFIELRFDDVQKDPLAQVKQIYDKFGLQGFDRASGEFSAYLGSIKGYKKNTYRFADDDLAAVRQHWQQQIERWGYAPPD